MKKDIEETIEHFIPSEGLYVETYINKSLASNPSPKEERLKKQAIHHLARYHWAARVLKNSPPGRVLDIACGAGYGSFILAQTLPNHTIIGGDYDIRAVEYANKTYCSYNLAYENLDVVTWKHVTNDKHMGNFDYIVSFDTIEHLFHREISLVNFSEFLEKNGMLLFSTPCGRRENLLNPGWEHHKIEYSFKYLYNIMKRFYKDVMIPDNNSLPELDYWKDIINKDEQRYLLRANPMVCKNPISHTLGWF